MTNVLFVCLHNAGRSQMSKALFDRYAPNTLHARSAGTQPAGRIHPVVVEAMRELDIDLADCKPHLLTDDDAQWADIVVTMGCGDSCPYIPGRRYVDWELPDPAGQPLEAVRALRDDIGARVSRLADELAAATAHD